MQIIDIPTEQTTAATDILLALVSALGAIWIYRSGHPTDRKKTTIWMIAFILLALAAILGSIAHGVKMPEHTNKLIWQPLNLFLGLAVAFFVIGVIYDSQEFNIQKSIILLILIFSIVFFLVTLLFSGLFFVFIVYESFAMLFALCSYSYLFLKRKFPGAIFMALGIFTSIIAAIIQAVESISLNFFWLFDHNGLFHLFQVIGLFLLYIGLFKEFKSRSYNP
jgi:hypothetical protein